MKDINLESVCDGISTAVDPKDDAQVTTIQVTISGPAKSGKSAIAQLILKALRKKGIYGSMALDDIQTKRAQKKRIKAIRELGPKVEIHERLTSK